MLSDLQNAFRRYTLDGDVGPLPDWVCGNGMPAARRLAVYRNNVMGSLIDVLAAAYPTVCRLVGEPFFRFAAASFAAAAPPVRPHLMSYGGGFAGFLARFEPAADLPYLPDLARLEWAR